MKITQASLLRINGVHWHVTRTTLYDTDIFTLRKWTNTVWQFICTSQGEDVVINPDGTHIEINDPESVERYQFVLDVVGEMVS